MVANGIGGSGPGDWRRKRKIRVFWMAGGLLVALLAITFWPRSNATDDLDTAFAPESTTTLDRSPFVFPRHDGPVTIPENQLQTTTTEPPPPPTTAPPPPPTTTTTIPPTTTTTTLPLPYIPSSNPACLAVKRVLEIVRRAGIDQNPDTLIPYGLAKLDAAISLLRKAGEPQFTSTIEVVTEVRDAVAKARTYDDLTKATAPLSGTDPRLAPIAQHVRATCPSLPIS